MLGLKTPMAEWQMSRMDRTTNRTTSTWTRQAFLLGNITQTSSRPGVGPGVGRPQWWHWGCFMIGMTTVIRNHLQNWFETVKRYTFLLMLLVSERMKFKIIKHQGWCHVEMFEMRPVDCSFLEFSRPVCYQVTCWHLRRFSIIFLMGPFLLTGVVQTLFFWSHHWLLVVRCAFRLYLYPHGYGMMWFLGLLGATGWPQKTVSWRRSEPDRWFQWFEM